MNIEKAMKVLKAAERLKKYCSNRKFCKDCIFYCDNVKPNSVYSDCCMIRQKNPEEYDLEEITRGLVSE